MDKNDIIEYVMHTPHNTNRAVLSSMLNQLAEGGDDSGSSWTVLTEESVTTIQYEGIIVGDISYPSLLNADTIRVTFNGTQYECSKVDLGDDGNYYGGIGQSGPDFTDYPFAIISNSTNDPVNALYTETAGTYNIKIEAPQSGDGSSDFSTAQVTLANNPNFAGGVPYCASLGGMEGVTVNTLGDGTYTVPLWKGHLYLIFENITATVTGDAALIYDGMAVDVYGDCTITKVS